MKKWILVLGLILSYNAQAYDYNDCFGASGCQPCPNSTDGKCFYAVEGSKMTIYGPTSTEQNADGSLKETTSIPRYAFTNSDGTSNLPENITSLEITGNITTVKGYAFYSATLTNVQFPETLETISESAFWNNNLSQINFPNSLKNIGKGAFNWNPFSEINLPDGLMTLEGLSGVPLRHVVIPDSVAKVKDAIFSSNSRLQSLVVGADTMLGNIFTYTTGSVIVQFDKLKMFCAENNGSCTTALQSAGATQEQIAQILISYTKDDATGVYQTSDGKYYADVNLMARQMACENKQSCEIASADIRAGRPFDMKGKSYASVDDFIQGKYIPKRIYTIDEANHVAGKTNTFKIRYR